VAPATHIKRTYCSKKESFKSGYGPEVDNIVNSARTESDFEYLLKVVGKFKWMNENFAKPASELVPYFSFFPNALDPTNPPPPNREPIPVEPWPTYAQLRGLTGDK